MSLNWNLENIEDHENVCFVWRKPQPSEGTVDPEYLNENGEARYMAPLTEALIFATISVKIGEITEENVAEFYARAKFIENVYGAYTYKIEDGKKVDNELTPAEVQAHIGLRCNVIDEDRETFLAQFDYALGDHLREFKRKTRDEAAV